MSDLKRVLNKELPQEMVPAWDLVFQLWEVASGKKFLEGRTFEALTESEKDKALNENAEIIVSVSEKYNFSAVTTPGGYWEVAPGEPAYYWLPEDARYKQIELIRKLKKDDLVLCGNASSVLAIPESDKYVEFACKLFEAPDEIVEMAKKLSKKGLEEAAKLRDVGVEMITTSSDIADNHGPFFKPDQFKLFVLPYLQTFAKAIKEMGCFPIMHTDGNITMYLDELADSGIAGLQAIDPVAGMNMKETKDKVAGRIALCGNVDCGILLTATPEEVFNATKNLLLECKTDGGLVLGASNAVQPEVPLANYEAMVNARKEFGKY